MNKRRVEEGTNDRSKGGKKFEKKGKNITERDKRYTKKDQYPRSVSPQKKVRIAFVLLTHHGHKIS